MRWGLVLSLGTAVSAITGGMSTGGAEHLSPHVYVVKEGNRGAGSNVGFVIGSRSILVVDSGLSPSNGQRLWKELQTISTLSTLYVTATHFHPEHMLGESGFPASATILRSQAQQRDITAYGAVLAARAGGDAAYRRPDILFNGDLALDLGSVVVRIIELGPAHTAGDLGVFVEGDRVAFTGDVATSGPLQLNPDSSFSSTPSIAGTWLASLERLAALQPVSVVPSHGPLGDTAMINRHRTFLAAVHQRVRILKQQGHSADATARTLVEEFRTWYPGGRRSVEDAARLFYAELRP